MSVWAGLKEIRFQGAGLRRFLSFTFACLFAVFTALARGQQVDLMVGGNSLFSSKPTSASLAYPPPAEKGGMYPSGSIQFHFKNNFGFNVETAFRYDKGLYNGFQRYRPALYDANALYSREIGAKTSADLMAGVGGERVLFYNEFATCNPAFGNCPTFVSSTHFLAHLGAGARYYVWRNFFVRPEVHYYYVMNNREFHSNNLFRAGVSIGYSFGR